MSDFNFKHIVHKDFAFEGLALVSIYFWKDGFATIVRSMEDETFVILYGKEGEIVSRFSVGMDVCRIMVAQSGKIAVGYAGNLRETIPCFALYSSTGKIIYECNEDSARACMDLTIDGKGNVWASCFPDVVTYKITPPRQVEKMIFPVSAADGLIPITIGDKEAIIQQFSHEECYAPINYLCTGEGLSEVIFDDLAARDIVGGSAHGSMAILLDNHDKLHFFDLNNANKTLA